MTSSHTPSLNSPFGGLLVDLLGTPLQRSERRERASRLPSVQISARAACDLELLATGAFSPLDRFMSRADHERVLGEMRLANGTLFPMPITLPVDASALHGMGEQVALRDASNHVLAILQVEDAFPWDRAATAMATVGSTDARHPLVAEMERWGDLNLTGKLEMIELPQHPDFKELRLTPHGVRERLVTLGARLASRGEVTGERLNVVAFQTRNPLHRVHEELTRRAIDGVNGVLLLHPVVGLTKPGDVDHFTRVRTTSPSSTVTCRPRSCSSTVSRSATVLLPAPERPVNQMHTPCLCRGGCASARMPATSGRVNHSGSSLPWPRKSSRTCVPEMFAVSTPSGTREASS